MHHKIVHNNSFDYADDPRLVSLMPVSSRGLDRSHHKVASLFETDPSEIKAAPNTSVLRLIAMGAGERVGPNRNADWFSRATLKSCHKTFVTCAKVYKHHDSRPEVASGSVLASAYNDGMDRVELIIQVDNGKWSDELGKLERGDDLKFSMGCDVNYDVCKICGNKAKNRTEYCDCMKKSPRQITEDGDIVCVDNPNPTMRDISYVIKPADRTAFILEKIASEHTVVTGADLYLLERPVHIFGKQASESKLAAVEKLAKMTKEIELSAEPFDKPEGSVVEANLDADEAKDAADWAAQDPDDFFAAMDEYRIVLTLPDFVKILQQVASADQTKVTVDLSAVGHSKVGEEVAKSCSYDYRGQSRSTPTRKKAAVLEKLAQASSTLPQFVLRRMRNELTRTTEPSHTKLQVTTKQASEYLRYCVSGLVNKSDTEIRLYATGAFRNWQ